MLYLTIFCEGLVGFVLLLACFAKLVDLRSFAQVVRGYRLIPEPLVNQVSFLLPLTESLIGFGLLSGRSPFWFPVFAAALFTCFAVAVIINLVRGNRNIACGCFGSSSNRPIGWGTAGRSVFLAIIASVPIFTQADGAEIALPERLIVVFLCAAVVGVWSILVKIQTFSTRIDSSSP